MWESERRGNVCQKHGEVREMFDENLENVCTKGLKISEIFLIEIRKICDLPNLRLNTDSRLLHYVLDLGYFHTRFPMAISQHTNETLGKVSVQLLKFPPNFKTFVFL